MGGGGLFLMIEPAVYRDAGAVEISVRQQHPTKPCSRKTKRACMQFNPSSAAIHVGITFFLS